MRSGPLPAAPAAAAAAASAPAEAWLSTAAVQKTRLPDGTKSINGFRVLESLGSGTFAEVKLCEEESSAERFAIKIFRKGLLRKKRDFVGGGSGGRMRVKTAMDKVQGEVGVMKRIRHPNCIRLCAVFDEATDPDGKMYIVIEYAGKGCTMDWDADRNTYAVPATGATSIPVPQARLYACDMLHGLNYLHSIRIAHRDIKPQNLLLNGDDVLKIGDFGVAKEMGEDWLVHDTEGTYYFFSPEMCRPGYKGHDGRRADVWAFGVSLWAFLFGSLPFFEQDLMQLLEGIAQATYALPPEAEAVASKAGLALLCNSLQGEPAERPLSEELLQHEWCQQAVAAAGMRTARPTAQMR